MKDLAKLELDPNTVYNVSLSVTQGTKKFDNLRFFQSKTPKLFNIIPGEYSTFSRLSKALKPVIPKIGGGVYTPADLKEIQVDSVSWEVTYDYDFSEGEASINLNNSTVDLRIVLASAPPTFLFQITGFNSKFACLNGRSDWRKINSRTYEVSIPVLEWAPGSTSSSNYVTTQTASYQSKYFVKKGQSLIYLKQKPDNVIAGLSKIGSVSSTKKPFANNTQVTYVQDLNIGPGYYIIVNPVTITDLSANVYINFTRYEWKNSVSWSGGRSKSGSEGSSAKLEYYSSPSYTPITTTYSFTGNSSVTSEILNSTVLDSLIWEKDIRDFVYFFISDTLDTSNTWYYFDNSSANGGITPATLEDLTLGGSSPLSIASGTGEERVLNLPPSANSYITNPSQTSYPPAALKAKAEFYNISKTNKVNDATSPNLDHAIGIRFAIARYVRSSDGINWSRSWLGTDNRMKNVLSQTEALS